MDIQSLMDQAKLNSGIPSDNQLAKAMKVSQGAVWKWRKGRDLPRIEYAHDLAKLAGLDPAEVVAQILILSEKRPEVRKTLERLKSALAAAAVIAITLLPGEGAPQIAQIEPVNNIHYTHITTWNGERPNRPSPH